MNVEEYISSGIVESYVFGLASKAEQVEFERMCTEYPAVKAAREAFELLLEKHALNQAVEPPIHLKSKIFSDLGISPGRVETRDSRIPLAEPLPGKVVSMPFRYIAAASIILLVGSTVLNFYFFSQYKESSAKYEQLVQSQNQTASANKVLQTKLQDYESALSMIEDPQMAIVKMPGVPASPNPASLATIYWDTRSKDVYLLVNNLPQPTTDKQYQLWALVDGKPVDAGVFDIKQGLSFVKMKNIQRAQAFAVTLEKRGGSAAPTLTAMYVLGKVAT